MSRFFDYERYTFRLILRPWRSADYELFARLNADTRVMEYFPKILDRAEKDKKSNGTFLEIRSKK